MESSSSSSPYPDDSPPTYTNNERTYLVPEAKTSLDPPPSSYHSSSSSSSSSPPYPSAYPSSSSTSSTPSPFSSGNNPKGHPQGISTLAAFCNFWWFFMGGGVFIMMIYLAFALVLAITVVGWPLAVDLFRVAMITAFPFGRQIVLSKDCGCKRLSLQVLWLPLGLCIYFVHLGLSIMLMMSLIFIPFGLQHFALARFALWPFSTKVYIRDMECGDLFSVSHYIQKPARDDQIEIDV